MHDHCGNASINRDLVFEAVAVTTSVKTFNLPASIKFSIVVIPLSFTKKSVFDLLAVMIVVGLRKHFIALRMEKRVANFSLNLMSSCMVRMMIPS